MKSLERSEFIASYLLENSNWGQDLSEMNFKEVQSAQHANEVPARYAVHGEQTAKTVIIEPAPYLTPVDSEHYRMRLAAQQRVLGPDFCVVGVEAYPNKRGDFTRSDRKDLAHGGFKKMSERVLTVIEDLKLNDDQDVMLYGYSLGADTAVQTAHDIVFDEKRGIRSIVGLGAVEFARSKNRNPLQTVLAMQQSGNDLAKNIYESQVPALDEAWGTTRTDEFSKEYRKPIDSEVMKGLPGYFAASLLGNVAIVRGFSTDASVQQMIELSSKDNIPNIMAGRYDRSKVCDARGFELLGNLVVQDRIDLVTQSGDHSADDNIRASAGRLHYFLKG